MVTPSSSGSVLDRDTRRALLAKQRAMVARQAIVPYLLAALEPARRESDEVAAAALIALAKLGNDQAARFGWHLLPEFVDRFVAQVGDRGDRCLEIV